MFYIELFKVLEAANIDYLLVGGLAMNLHGVPRMTMDIDLIIALNAENVAKFEACMKNLDIFPNVPVKLSELVDTKKREALINDKHLIALSLISKKPALPAVDIVIFHPLNFNEAFKNRVVRDIAGTRVFLASIEDMITMKKSAGRMQDLADVKHLERFLNE